MAADIAAARPRGCETAKATFRCLAPTARPGNDFCRDRCSTGQVWPVARIEPTRPPFWAGSGGSSSGCSDRTRDRSAPGTGERSARARPKFSNIRRKARQRHNGIGSSIHTTVSARAKRMAEAEVNLPSMTRRAPAATASTLGRNSSNGLSVHPGRQYRLSRWVTGRLSRSPKAQAKVDLPPPEQPTMATRSMTAPLTGAIRLVKTPPAGCNGDAAS